MNRHVSNEHGKNLWTVENSMHSVEDSEFGWYQDFWGDQYRWTSLLPFAWKMIDYPWFEFPKTLTESPSDNEVSHDAAAATWNAALHLLGLGMGWSDIGKGLTEWETLGFSSGHHPVLDMVIKLCGEDIESLIMHVGKNFGSYLQVFSSIDESPSKMSQNFVMHPELDSMMRNSSNKENLSYRLLFGGYDPLHLTVHFKNSVIGRSQFSRNYRLEQLNDDRYILHLPRYAAWALQLKNCGASSVNELDEVSYGTVEVQIENLGSLGVFVGGGGGHLDRRWFRHSETYKEIRPGSQYASHSWGF